MSLQIGRVTGLSEPTEPPGWQNNSDGTISVSAVYRATSVTDGLVKRDQMLGYLDNLDELVVPVIMDNEPRVTGYYRVVSVQATTDKFTRKSGHQYGFVVTLQPVQGFTQPWLESVISGALLTNVLGAVGTDVNWFHAVPAAVSEYSDSANPANSPNRSSADGNVTFFWDSGVGGISSIARFGLTPANFYVGACKIEQGSPLAPVVGRTFVQADVVNWRLSNGMVRVTPNGTDINVSHWNGSIWSPVKAYRVTVGGIAPSTFNSVTVLRNSPEECILRLSMSGGIFAAGTTATGDLSLRRGDRVVRLYISSTSTQSWALRLVTAEAATALGAPFAAGGIRATVDDADSNRYVMLSFQQAVTEDLVNGRLTLNAGSKTADFAMSSVVGGGAGAAPNDPISLGRQYLAAQSESQRVVSR